MPPLIDVLGLHKSFSAGGGGIHVLRGIDLSADEGEFLSIVGQSGAGKSTLLHIMGALDRPDRGEVIFDGKSVFRGKASEIDRFRNREVGFVFQFHHLMSEFTALENTMMPALVASERPSVAASLAREILGEVGLAERLHHRPGQLSGGEQQRVAVARALVMSPRLLLADEPTGNLDHESSGAVFELLKEINRRRKLTLVMVTHNRDLAKATDRTLTLSAGVVDPGT